MMNVVLQMMDLSQVIGHGLTPPSRKKRRAIAKYAKKKNQNITQQPASAVPAI